jgi:asparagine synthase (glutamine-hydrolysing)
VSGICGLWHRDGRPVERGELSQMSAAIRHRGLDGEGQWINGSAGFAFQATHITPESGSMAQPFLSSSGVVVMFEGRLDNREELGGSLDARLTQSSADCEYIAAAYRAYGADAFARLLGDFAIAIFDPGERKLLLARDRMWLRPLYYCSAEGSFFFGSEIKAILAHPSAPLRPSDDGLADLLMPGDAQCMELTLFDGIFRVGPGELIVVSGRGYTRKQFWDFDTSAQVRCEKTEGYAHCLREAMECAVRRRLRSAAPVAVMVSGGLDSSAIYSIGRRTPGVPEVFGLHITYPGYEESNEESFVDELERFAGQKITRLPPPESDLSELERAVWLAEGPFPPLGFGMLRLLVEATHAGGAKILLNGSFGDQALGSPEYMADLIRSWRWSTLLRHTRVSHEWATDVNKGFYLGYAITTSARAFAPEWLYPAVRTIRDLNPATQRRPKWFSESLRQRARGRAMRQQKLHGHFASHHAKVLYQKTRWPGYVRDLEAAGKVFSSLGVDEALPLWDRDLLALVMAIPGDVLNLDGVPKGLYREAMRGILPEAIRLRRFKCDFSRYVNTQTRNELPAMLKRLTHDCLGVKMGYLNGAELRERIAGSEGEYANRTSSNPSRRAAALIGLELWLEVFFGRPRSEIIKPPQTDAAVSVP